MNFQNHLHCRPIPNLPLQAKVAFLLQNHPLFLRQPPSISVLYPNGGETFTEGSQVNIRWNTNGLSSNQKLNIVLNAGLSGIGETIAKDVANTGSYLWTVKSLEEPFYAHGGGSRIILSGRYTISVVCSQQNYATCKFNRNFDTSDSVFTITKQSSSSPLSITVQSPNGGEMWSNKFSEYIYFTSNFSKQPVKIWAQNTQNGLVTILDESYVTIDSNPNRAGWSPSRAPLIAGSYKICVGADIHNPLDCSNSAFTVASSSSENGSSASKSSSISSSSSSSVSNSSSFDSSSNSSDMALDRDAKRVADINNLRVALELYFDINSTYPPTATWKTDLAPTYIRTIPKDPLTADYTYEKCSSALYHLGAAFEESTNSKLASNNNAAVPGCLGTWGGNTSVCSGVPGINQGYFCYDVKP